MKKVRKQNRHIIYDLRKLKDTTVKTKIEKKMPGHFVTTSYVICPEEAMNSLNMTVESDETKILSSPRHETSRRNEKKFQEYIKSYNKK